MSEIIKSCVYQEPPSIFSTASSVLTILGLGILGILEVTGRHLQYSKFWNFGGASIKSSRNQTVIPSKIGMLVFYTPALLAGISSIFIYPGGGTRFLLLKSAIIIHFLKRDLEVLFLHKFSGFIVLDSAIVISTIYVAAAAGMAYFHNTTRGFPEPAFDLKYIGVFLFVVGTLGNFYHHYLLAKLRDTSDKGYKIPKDIVFVFVCDCIGFISSWEELYYQKMMMAEIIKSCVYQEPSSTFSTASSVLTLLAAGILGILEATGKQHLQYSKFWNFGGASIKGTRNQTVIPSKIGMLVLYTPALLAGISSFYIFPGGGTRFLLLKLAITIHFLKRVLEVLFLHKFSGFIALDSAIIISTNYVVAAAGMVYFHNTTQGFPEPAFDLKYIGVFLFMVGTLGNFYHHYLLSKLRDKSDKGYKIPKGGLFSLVTCPHYLFEITVFMGIAFISQTLFLYSCAFATASYLAGRSYTTRKWYISKFENFPKNVKCLVPFVF